LRACSRCGQANPEGFRFCGFCAAPLEKAREQREERRIVSALFVDLVGFTERFDQADPEDVQAILRPYHGLVKRDIERFGGVIEKFIGDAVVGVFGFPVVHEDDPERAVRAALQIAHDIERSNAEEPALDLVVRLAVTTGEAVVVLDASPEEGESFVAGDVLNTASRLQTMAPPGSVVVDRTTYVATIEVIDWEPLDAAVVKGKSEPIPIWRAVRVVTAGRVRARPHLTPFIGRKRELALLHDTCTQMLRGGESHLVRIKGEPGGGKSRLLSEFGAAVDRRLVSWREGRCGSYGDAMHYSAVGEIIKDHVGILEIDDPRNVSAKLRAAVALTTSEVAEQEWLVTRLAPLVGELHAGTVDRDDAFRAWIRFFEIAALHRPLVLVLEDLHWADAGLVEFAKRLVEASLAVPLLVICTARPDFIAWDDWNLATGGTKTIVLAPLSRDETATLMGALLGGVELPRETNEAVLDRSGGNPLYAREFVRMLSDRGIVRHSDGAVALEHDAGILVPHTVQSLIAARLDTIPPEHKQLVQNAAVCGETFWGAALGWIGDTSADNVREGLEDLAGKELIRHVRPERDRHEQAEYAFSHVLVRDVAYSQIPRVERIQKHRAAAEWILHSHDRSEDAAEVLAHHYVAAFEIAKEARDEQNAESLAEPARNWLTVAGDRAARLDARSALTYYERALTLQRRTDPDHPEVLVKAGEAAHQCGELDEAARYYQAAAAAFATRSDAMGAGEALVRLSRLFWWRGETEKGRNLIGQAVEMLEQEKPSPQLALAYARVAGDHAMAGTFADALEWSERARRMANDLGLDDVANRAQQYRGLARCEGGDLGGLDDLRGALQGGLELGLGHETATAYDNLGDWVWLTEGPSAGIAINQAGVEFARRHGQTETATWTRTETLWMLFDGGEWDEVLRVADEVLAWDRSHGINQVGVIALTHRALVLTRRGQAAAAAALAGDFLDRARTIRDPEVLVPALTAAALIHEAEGNLGLAVQLVEELELATRGKPVWRLRNVPEVGSVCARAGTIGLLRQFIDGVEHTAERPRLCALTGRALLAQ
jgi:class 3 adenylate cyclase/tetratricopeptide (TPR) repeat protein